MVPPLVRTDHSVPRVDKEKGVASGAVNGRHDLGTSKLDGRDFPDGGCPVGSEQVVVIAGKDASFAVPRRLQKLLLVTFQADHGEAVEGRETLRGHAIDPRAELLASPLVVVVILVGARLATLAALPPNIVFRVALHVHADATTVIHAS